MHRVSHVNNRSVVRPFRYETGEWLHLLKPRELREVRSLRGPERKSSARSFTLTRYSVRSFVFRPLVQNIPSLCCTECSVLLFSVFFVFRCFAFRPSVFRPSVFCPSGVRTFAVHSVRVTPCCMSVMSLYQADSVGERRGRGGGGG